MTDEQKPPEESKALQIGAPMKDVAAHAFALAMKKDTENRTAQIIGQMTGEMEKLRKMIGYRDTANMVIDFLQKRIAALEAGEFTIGPRDQIRYNDENLNENSLKWPDGSATFV